ncbi:PREDICTED: uncharacterized protein LOC109590107 [Amphimedon queenslandica]|uniref:Protein kinase domain-containing protein n=1 Tax=Amphimedon queenslandica TaxID=400682 RepID=A0AAN0JXD9_AMPQE|nr:PREDICTED: uncharacterized protein LOC109590107 [Amphimedon queenslandica]|eukprot:XP_019861610.1 PREDICTED: uncharacterized protein LOC109590107 [Amphimedon queenslandica]
MKLDLLVLLSICLLQAGTVESCTEGFMSQDLLTAKAEQITSCVGSSVTALAESQPTRWIFGRHFRPKSSCSSSHVITGLTLGVDIRSVNESRNEYPLFEIWTRDSNSNSFIKQQSISVALTPANFSTNGTYQFIFPTPISFNSNTRLGIYQPANDTSVVRFYRVSQSTGIKRVEDDDINNDQLSQSDLISTSFNVLIHPITEPSDDCFQSFLSQNDVIIDSSGITRITRVTNEVRAFPDIRFTCNGTIKNIILGTLRFENHYPLIQLKRSSQLINVLRPNITGATNISTNLYNVSLINPVEVKPNDILVIDSSNDARMYYQQYNGPLNYEIENHNGELELEPLDSSNNYPLISIVASASTSEFVSASNYVSLDVSATTSPSTGPESLDNNIGVIAGTITSAIILIIGVTILVIVIVLIARTRNKRKTIRLNSLTITRSASSQIDHDYTIVASGSFSTEGSNMYHKIHDLDYSQPVDNTIKKGLYNPSYSEQEAPKYETVTVHKLTSPSTPVVIPSPNTLENPMYTDEIIGSNIDKNSSIVTPQMYAVPISSSQAKIDPSHAQLSASPTQFVQEEPLYWQPGDDTDCLYHQLSSKGFREIAKKDIQTIKELGSGQFGTVYEGMWLSKPVAIKTLKNSSVEQDKVKFLQEAAIMGQFHHPNIVKLHGMVTVGEPLMIVLELIPHGDMRQYLHTLQPQPGELVASTVPGLLLSFCRQIASGMEYLSKKGFVHRDLAARNILMTDHGMCKIADFGMSRDLHDENYYVSTTAKRIPIKWTAPEALHFKRYSSASDVWSYGVVMYEIWSLGHKPFENCTNQECLRRVDSGFRLPPPPGCPRSIYEMMIQCWHPDTGSRPTFVQLVSRLSLSDAKLLSTVSSDTTVIGGPLETGYQLYTELQNMYQ